MNPNSSTEVSVRSDIIRDLESASEQHKRIQADIDRKTNYRAPKDLIDREEFKASLELLQGETQKNNFEKRIRAKTAVVHERKPIRRFRLNEQNIFHNNKEEKKDNIANILDNFTLQVETKQKLDYLQEELNAAREDLRRMGAPSRHIQAAAAASSNVS